MPSSFQSACFHNGSYLKLARPAMGIQDRRYEMITFAFIYQTKSRGQKMQDGVKTQGQKCRGQRNHTRRAVVDKYPGV